MNSVLCQVRYSRHGEPGLFDNSPLLGDLFPRPKRRRRRGGAAQAGEAAVDRSDAQAP